MSKVEMTMGVREVAMAIKGAIAGICDAGNVLGLDGTNANIPDSEDVVIGGNG